jgi:hypothetical protein
LWTLTKFQVTLKIVYTPCTSQTYSRYKSLRRTRVTLLLVQNKALHFSIFDNGFYMFHGC